MTLRKASPFAYLQSCFYLMLLLLPATLQARELPEFTQLIEERSPAVVKINTIEKARNRRSAPQRQDIPEIFRHLFEQRQRQQPQRQARSMGSGFIISEDGYLLTNNHVIDGADEITVNLLDHREFDAKVIGVDARSDLALLKIEASDLPYLSFGDSDDLKVGQWVLAIGSPFGLDFTASQGIVSAIGRSIPTENNENYVPFIQTDVAINPGNSGGPLFNLNGEVIGINSQIFTRSGGSNGLSFAIPASVAKEVVAQLREKGRVDRGWLGVAIQDVDSDLAASLGMSKPVGALISQIDPKGPAAESGLRAGDVIIKFGDYDINDSGELPHAVGRTAPGSEVEALVMREGKRTKIDVTVGSLSGENDQVAGTRANMGGRMGLEVEEVGDRLRRAWNLDGGVIIKRVRPESPAAKAGLRPGMVIVQMGFKEVKDVEGFHSIIAELPAEELLPIRFFVNGRPVFRSFSLPE
ncbi:DegQ family serine endoprotease [Pseudoteredinibacter isoporae]|uniref:DegQ family serine endoprotease n=1 Tax=Pseudoteredinibacter isoporae TaxID=570281 RepID=UPI003EBE5D64